MSKIIKLDTNNFNKHTEDGMKLLEKSIQEVGAIESICIDKEGEIISGNARFETFEKLGYKPKVIELENNEYPVIATNLEGEKRVKAAILANTTAKQNINLDIDLIQEIAINEFDIDIVELGVEIIDFGLNCFEKSDIRKEGSLAERFIIPPFSILDSKSGKWQERKNAWLSLGIKSDAGRDKNLTYGISAQTPRIYEIKNQLFEKTGIKPSWEQVFDYCKSHNIPFQDGTSIFDPVLCELVYRWFNIPNGTIIDPFSGGSVRGIVASKLGMQYYGVDLRQEQIDANYKNAKDILINSEIMPNWICGDSNEILNKKLEEDVQLTPIQKIDNLFIKRDDLFTVCGVRGGKARSAYYLIRQAMQNGYNHIVTAGSRKSPQIEIIGNICNNLNLKFTAFTPCGELSNEINKLKSFANIIQVKYGYNNVIKSRAKEFSIKENAYLIPFGMECTESINQTMKQVENIPDEVNRIVIPVGSGMSLCGLLNGLKYFNKNISVIGIQVGADYKNVLDKYAPKDWKNRCEIIKSEIDYHKEVNANIGNIILDPIYESKCKSYLKDGDLLWIIGARNGINNYNEEQTINPIIKNENKKFNDITNKKFDLIFSCPPYADLEVYSNDKRDLSNMEYDEFIKSYNEIIQKTCYLLNDNRFAVFVVGEVRNKMGVYYNFVSDTINAFQNAGLSYYNEMILATQIASSAIIVPRQFNSSRKIGKIHQNVLVFYKGDIKKIKNNFSEIDFSEDDILKNSSNFAEN